MSNSVPAKHTITAKGREALLRIAEAQAAGTPLLEGAIDGRHLQSIEELIAYRTRYRENGRPHVMQALVITDTGRYVLARDGRPDLSRALRDLEKPDNKETP